MIFPFAIRVLLLASVSFASLQIVPGASWTAAGSNAHIQAHGGGFIKVHDTFYWIGENKTSGADFQSVTCYSSTDLVQWTFVNNLLSLRSSGDLGPNRIVERPKVIYNSGTSQYVMWMHIDDLSYSEAKTGVAVSSSVCGDYTYRGSFQPLGFQSRDMGLFQDTDGTGYLLSEDRAHGLRIDKLSSDYLTVESNTYLFADYEAPALIKQDGVYFMFASHLTGWKPNDNQYSTATSLSGPWSAWADFAPAGTNTYDSQTNYVLQVGDSAFYLGDRWVASDLGASTYVWLPLVISGTKASVVDSDHWVMDAVHGHWSTGPPAEIAPEAESASNTLTNPAVVISCSDCSGGKAVGDIGGPPAGTLTFNGVTSQAATTPTIRIRYANADSTPRYATVAVNGVSHIVAFIPTGSDNTIFDSVLTTPLNKGSNTIEFSSYKAGWAANVDRLMVPVS